MWCYLFVTADNSNSMIMVIIFKDPYLFIVSDNALNQVFPVHSWHYRLWDVKCPHNCSIHLAPTKMSQLNSNDSCLFAVSNSGATSHYLYILLPMTFGTSVYVSVETTVSLKCLKRKKIFVSCGLVLQSHKELHQITETIITCGLSTTAHVTWREIKGIIKMLIFHTIPNKRLGK